MFAEHQPTIAAYASADAAQFRECATFVLATIRQPLWRTPGDLARVTAGDLAPMWGSKRTGYAWLSEHAEAYYRDALGLLGDRDALLLHLAQCPGLGLPKAGFLAQLAFGLSGCLDTHNIVRFGLRPEAFTLGAAKRAETRLGKARLYHATVDDCGGTAQLWDSWCRYVYDHGRGAKARYADAEEVSAYHCRALGLRED